MNRPEGDPRAAAAVCYDGSCPLCRREIAWYRRMAGAERVEWRDASSGRLPEGLDRDALMGRFMVHRRDGGYASGAAGFAAFWRALRSTRRLGQLADRQPFLAIGEMAYSAFLRLRRLWRPSRTAPPQRRMIPARLTRVAFSGNHGAPFYE